MLIAVESPIASAQSTRIPIRVVVVTTFEIGADTGDRPGEFQEWVERLPLRETLPFPGGYHHLRFDRRLGVLGMVSGEGPTRMASSITALGNDPRFDLRHAYWVLAGIAGIDPHVASLGSAAWAHYVADGDQAYEIDAREIPKTWSTGYVPFARKRPYQLPAPAMSTMQGTSLYALDRGFTDWAYRFTRRTALRDSPELSAERARYRGYPNAQRAPFVLEGDTLAAGTFWVGARMNAWAERWLAYWSNGRARYTTTAEEDAGMMQALTFLSHTGAVDLRRVLVLRTASDYDMPPPGESAAQLLASEGEGHYAGYRASVDAAYAVASPVVRELAAHWKRYRSRIPYPRMPR